MTYSYDAVGPGHVDAVAAGHVAGVRKLGVHAQRARPAPERHRHHRPSAAYGYDDASRLTSETITGDPRGASFNGALSYVLDGAGNRLSRTSTLAALGAQSFSTTPTTSSTAIPSTPTATRSAPTATRIAYDFENRLVSKDGGAVTVHTTATATASPRPSAA